MHRRTFVASALASISLKYLWPPALAQASLTSSHLPQKLADLHCHIFNADDLPIEGFVRKVIIPASTELRSQFRDYPDAFIALIRVLSTVMKEAAPSPAEEIALAVPPTASERRNKDLATIEKLLNRIWSREIPPGLDFKDGIAVNVAVTKLQKLLIDEVYPSFFCCGATQDDVENVPLKDMAERLYVSNGIVGRNTRWALLFTRYRFELADALQSFHGGKAVLATPALVDFSKWLEDDNVSNLDQQVAVMGRLTRRKTGLRIHPFMAFDPLRQALHIKAGGAESDSPLALVKKAIESEGFIGVKLYPPMGFRAFNNAGAGTDFPSHVRKPTALGKEPGKQLDDALAQLFTWCAVNHVPVMAHAANSNGAGPGYGTRANPRYWLSLLKQPNFSNLRINLAHFGGFEEGGSPEKSWEWSIGKSWQQSPGAFLYADISYFSEILQSDAQKRKSLMAGWKALREQFPQSANRLIYGSDWVMLGREKGVAPIDLQAHKPYSALVADFLSSVGYSDDQIASIMWRNASRFLGLGAEEKPLGTRARLEKFYSTEGINADWLTNYGV